MAIDIQDRPGIEERYQVAGNTSDLTVKAHQGGAGVIIIAAAPSGNMVRWVPLRLGPPTHCCVRRSASQMGHLER